MMQQVLANTSKIINDSKAAGSLLYLPLDKLMQGGIPGQSAAPADTTAARPGPVPEPQASPDTPARARDGLRGRERETR